MGLAGGIRRFCDCNHVIANRFHQLFDLIGVGLAQYFFAKADGIILKRAVMIFFVNPAEC
jgi:F0F1-type ATP synthase membrane subunit c/vacuolar-type H+-ATPase subunit K